MKLKVTATTRLELNEVEELKKVVAQKTGHNLSLSASIAFAVRELLIQNKTDVIEEAVKKELEKR